VSFPVASRKNPRAGFVGEGTAGQLEEKRRRLLAEMSAMDERRRALFWKTLENYDNAIREANGRCVLSHRWIPLEGKIPDDPQISSLVAAYEKTRKKPSPKE
jgi:hypothetical protein